LKFVAFSRAVYGRSTGVIPSTVDACTMKGSSWWSTERREGARADDPAVGSRPGRGDHRV